MIIYFFIFILTAYIFISTFYLCLLAILFFIIKEKKYNESEKCNKFIVLVPAHNEELLIGNLIESLLDINYPSEKYSIFIIADNCKDGTTDLVRKYPVQLLIRNDELNPGKGQALSWALQEIDLDSYDSVFMVDADNYVDGDILRELNTLINNGEKAIQCHNAVGNRNDSWFTQLLYVSRTIGNQLYHEAKYRLGLSSYLMGNGLCFRTDLLKQRGWTAFSTGEDWEYYAQLVGDGIKIGFAVNAKVYHQESKSLNQATSQRLRWSSGRFKIARTLGMKLFLKGLREKKWWVVDASFPLLLPNYSLLLNLTMVCLLVSVLLPVSVAKNILVALTVMSFLGQFFLFAAGSFLAGSLLETLKAIVFVPFFLIWKAIIDLLCLTGLYRDKKWVRTKRH